MKRKWHVWNDATGASNPYVVVADVAITVAGGNGISFHRDGGGLVAYYANVTKCLQVEHDDRSPHQKLQGVN